MEIKDVIKERRKQLGYTLSDIAKMVGVNPSTVSRWERGEIDNMKIDKIYELAMVLRLSPDVLMGWEEPPDFNEVHITESSLNDMIDIIENLSDKDINMLEKYNHIDEHGRLLVHAVLDIEYERCINKTEETISKVRYVNFYCTPASAGPGQVLYDNIDVDTIKIPDKPEYKRVSYAIRVSGDSMLPDFIDGDIILVEPTNNVKIGEVGIFSVSGDSYIKILGDGELVSLNKKYSPIKLTEDSRCMGRVVGKLQQI